MKVFVIIIYSLSLIAAKSAPPLTCPEVKAKNVLLGRQYMGSWYFTRAADCPIHNFEQIKCMMGDFNLYSAEYGSFWMTYGKYFGHHERLVGDVRLVSSSHVYAGEFDFYGMPDSQREFQFPHWVLGTDYLNYAVVYGCVIPAAQVETCTWILTRDPYPHGVIINAAKEVVRQKFGHDLHFRIIDQSLCPPTVEL